MLREWWLWLKQCSTPRSHGGRQGTAERRQFRPRAEALEDRTLLSAGGLDWGFGKGGKVLDSLGMNTGAASVAVQPDGKIIVAGSVSGIDTTEVVVARYNPDGRPDTAFGSHGHVLFHFGPGAEVFDQAAAVAVQADGKIVVAGSHGGLLGPEDFALARLTADGRLDAGFGTGGLVLTPFSIRGGSFWTDAAVTGLAIQRNGAIVAVGSVTVTYHGEPAPPAGFTPFAEFALARYRPDGRLDPGFGQGGQVLTSFAADPGQGMDRAAGVALQADGKIVVVGSAEDLNWPPYGPGIHPDHVVVQEHFALARYDVNGGLDASFGSGGKVLTDFPGSSMNAAAGVVVTAGGQIVAAGTAGGRFALAEYDGHGGLAADFGQDGLVLTEVAGSPPGSASAAGVALTPHGELVVVGTAWDPSTGRQDFALARYRADGKLDSGFGKAGEVLTPFAGDAQASAVALQSDGEVVAAGTAWDPHGGPQLALARYEGDEDWLAARALPLSPAPGSGQAFTAPVAAFTGDDNPGPAASYRATINWGDGSAATGVVRWVSGNTFRVYGTHTYARAGLYTIKVTIASADGTWAWANSSVFVPVTDPLPAPATSGIGGVARVGPITPVVHPGVADVRPLAGAVITVQPAGGGAVIARAVADALGRFRINLAPGTYLIVPLPPGVGRTWPRGAPQTVVVTKGKVTPLTVDYDSGIR